MRAGKRPAGPAAGDAFNEPAADDDA